MGGQEFKGMTDARQLPLQLLSNHLDASELQRSARFVPFPSNKHRSWHMQAELLLQCMLHDMYSFFAKRHSPRL